MGEQAHTEELIKRTARLMFFRKGLLGVTTQEIADEAGVNRALIHYYFRSREQLLDTLLEETITEKKIKMREILTSNLPFREKIREYINMIVDRGIEYPYLENFVVSEMARRPDKMKALCTIDRLKSHELIKDELEEEIRNGRMPQITAQHFMMNLSAMCSYPLLAKPVLQVVHGMSDAAYKKFLLERKQIVFCALFNEPVPEEKINERIKND